MERHLKARQIEGRATYLIAPDTGSGRKGRHHVYLLTDDDPVRIGCEIDLKLARSLVFEYEKAIGNTFYLGSRREALNLMRIVVGKGGIIT